MSLEDQCLLHLICHLEEYTPETLASLPLHLRRRLLVNLPALDVCQLEDSAIAEGIDLEVSVWKELLGKQGFSCVNASFKQKYFDEVYSEYFRGQFSVTSRWLYSAAGCLGVTNWECFPHLFAPLTPDSLYSPFPSRHVQYCQCLVQERLMSQLLSIVIPTGKSKFWPKEIYIACDDFVDIELWKRRGAILVSLLSEFFTKVSSLVFDAESIHNIESYNVPRFILELALSKPPVALTSLRVTGFLPFVIHTVDEASTFFSPGCCTQGRHPLHSFYSQMLSHTLPYSGLTSISITGNDELEPGGENLLYEQLESVVLHQSALESFSFQCSSMATSSRAFSLYTTLGSLFRQPQFRSLKLGYAAMDWKDLSLLVPPFLASPLSPGSEKELCFIGVSFELDGLAPTSDVDVEGCSTFPGKTLTFDDVTLSHGMPFFRWLSQHRCLQLLSSFEFMYKWYADPIPNLPGTAMALFAEKQAAAHLESFTVSGISLLFERSPVIPFINLFSAPRLRKVSLRECQISADGLLSALTQGLLNQVPVGELEELCLGYNGLGKSSAAQFRDFADAIFSLPQLTNLTLSLEHNELKRRHFSLMHDAWKVNANLNGKRMKTLKVSGNQYQESVIELREFAVN